MTTTIRGAVLAADHEHRIDAHLEQRGDYVPHDPITLVLEAVPARANGSKNPRLASIRRYRVDGECDVFVRG